MAYTLRHLSLVGQRFGRLEVKAVQRKENGWYAVSLCDCGNINERVVSNLKTPGLKSCGCWIKERMKQTNDLRTKHGMHDTPEYSVWEGIKQRCLNPKNCNYQKYGGRGISVCDRWLEFVNFFSDMGKKPTPKHTIERLDFNGNYEPENCIWADWKTQSRNKRTSIILEFSGKRQSLADWADHLGVPYSFLSSRYQAGWSVEEILNPSAQTKWSKRKKSA